MHKKTFYTGLLITTGLSILLSSPFFLFLKGAEAHLPFIIFAALAFAAFCISLFRISFAASQNPKGSLFIQVVMISVFLKMLLSLALVIGYKKLCPDTDNLFIGPFIVLYVVFTVFEVIFMDRLGRQKPLPKS